jgi:tRNA A-37 threonylcarbamoyl transferase component Bud32
MSDNAPGCPATETLCELVEGRLGETDRELALRHMETCSACRRALAEVGKVIAETPAERGSTPSLAPSSGSDRPPPSSAARLGRYEIRREAGIGGLGVVYEGWDPALGRRVALKLLRPDRGGADRASLTERLASEARALAKLSHPNVLAVFDVGVEGDAVFLAIEYVEGVTMDAGWPHRARSWRDRIEAYQQAARGLAAIHAAGLTHRDIKPTNILLGDDGRVRITDFGLAVPLDEKATPAGTPAYMAPEQLAGEAGPLADQYALAMCMVEAVLGSRPPVGASVEELDRRGRGVWGSSAPSRAVWEALGKALSVHPAERHPSVEALSNALAQSMSSAPPSRRIDPPSRRAGGARASVAAYAALAVAVAAVGVAAASALRAPAEVPRGPSAPDAPPAQHPAADATAPASAAVDASAHAPPSPDPAFAASSVASAARPGEPAAVPAAGGASAPASQTESFEELTPLERSARVQRLTTEASEALHARDGKTCLKKLDEAAVINPDSVTWLRTSRAPCEMLVGRCDEGVRLLKAEKNLGANAQALADNYRSLYCPIGSKGSGTPQERLKAVWLQAGAPPSTVARCKQFEAELGRAIKDHGKDPVDATAVTGAWHTIAVCYVNADDCKSAGDIIGRSIPEEKREEHVKKWLASTHPKCAK